MGPRTYFYNAKSLYPQAGQQFYGRGIGERTILEPLFIEGEKILIQSSELHGVTVALYL